MPDRATRSRRKLTAILMADVSGFSRMMSADEERTTGRIQEFHRRVKGLVESHVGRVVDTAGDSVFGEFASVVNAMRCAHEIQSSQAQANTGEPPDWHIQTRIGVHLGDVIIEDYQVYGDGVNIAARLEQLAEPGGICVSEAVYQQVHGKVDFEFRELGVRELKNIEQPIRLYTVPPRSLVAPELPKARARRRGRVVAQATRPPPAHRFPWTEELIRPGVLIPLLVAAGLLVSPLTLWPTAGVFPTAGAILLGLYGGRLAGRRTGSKGHWLIGLGLGVAAGAAFTNWSPVTNTLFVMSGLILSAVGVGRSRLLPRR
ncbi:MAG: adenylate/guanylate cyclase domain-containing protein [Myxococcota bacterium]